MNLEMEKQKVRNLTEKNEIISPELKKLREVVKDLRIQLMKVEGEKISLN